MATALAAQLAQIAANSKSSLNVKAQKASHSKSLIFEPHVAAGQSFHTIYTACFEGFEELCHLDGRFSVFSTTLFSEQSRDEDRTQMNAAENAELDRRIESFLRLVGSRLKLMPAIKAVEWLIRRFRIHEFNTAALLACFLPYHTLPVFLTLMSILPSKIPHEYRFLDPYIRSLTSPPRAVIVRQATNHTELLSAISAHVVASCRTQQHYPALITFWAGVMTEAVNGMLDKMRSGRKGIQADNDQTLLQQLGPTLSDALVMRKVPDLQIASYMVISILASKGSLNDAALSAFMEQLVHGWTSDTIRPGLACLAILAHYRSAKQLSGKVTKAILKVENPSALLLEIAQKQRAEKLANGLALALVDRVTKKGDARGLPVLKSILLSGILGEKQISVAFKTLLVAAHKVSDELDQDGCLRKELGLTIVTLAQAAGEAGVFIRKTIEDVDLDIEELELRLDTSIRPAALLDKAGQDVAMEEAHEVQVESESLEAAIERLSVREHAASSCFFQQSESIFDEICNVFISTASNQSLLPKLDEAPLLKRDTSTSEPFYFTFYIRIWCGPYPTLARVAALEMVKERLKDGDFGNVDLQAIIPYCIAAMSDQAKKVRKAAADLLTVFGDLYVAERPEKQSIWGSEGLYEASGDMRWMDRESTAALLHSILLPALEESILHEEHASTVLSNALDSPTKSAARQPLSHATRLSILACLAGHVNLSPIILVKLRLLNSLNQVRGVSGTSRTQLLLPCLRSWAGLSATAAAQRTTKEKMDQTAMDAASVQVVLPNDKLGLDLFFDLVRNPTALGRPNLIQQIFLRIRRMWSSMKGEAKFATAQTMLVLSQDSVDSPGEKMASLEAADLLRNVDLSTDILQDFLDKLQDAAKMATDPPPNKRRRTSTSEHSRALNISTHPELGATLGKITFVLQLIEGSRPAEHPQLLQSLFVALSDLQHLRAVVGSELGYLQNLVLGCLLAMMPAYQRNKELKIDTSVGHGDVLVTCIQRSSSPAVQNAALLLVASLAKTAPEVVLHSVMPIFTFMGNSVLRQGDDYSAHVINQTIKEVVPPLIETFRKSRRNPVVSASELLSSFVIAYEHIPSHRKHDLFFSLIENLGPEEFLYALVAMFVDKYGTTDNIVTFLVRIMDSFSVEIQLQTLVQFLDLVGDIFKPKPGLSMALLGKNEDGDQDLQKAALKELTVLPELLSNKRLKAEIGRLAERDDMDAAKMRDLYATLLEGILALSETTRSRKLLHSRCGDGLSSLLNLLSIAEFIKAVETLLDRPNNGLRQKVLRALEVRIDDESGADPKSRAALLAFLPQLTAVIRESDDILYKHTAVACVDKIADKYGKKDIEAVTAAASTIASDYCLGQPDGRLRIMALLCLASLVDVLQDGLVPILPIAVPKTLEYLRESLAGPDPNCELHNAGLAFITALIQHVPYMVSEALLNELLLCSNISAEAGLDEVSNANRRDCLRFLAKLVEAKTLFSALEHNWPSAAESGFSALGEYLDILGMAIDKHPKSVISRNTAPLSAIFLNAFDLRRLLRSKDGNTGGVTSTKIEEMEATVNETALKMIYKLNDATFRPIFSQLMEWTVSGPSKQDSRGRILRQQAVYGFLAAFFGNLKSIVTSYATYVVDGAVSILRSIDPKGVDGRELWRLVLRTLTKCFEHDQDDFWQAPSHFEAIAPVLTAQVLHAAVMDVSDDLIPAIVGLASAADSSEHQKELNGAILRHLRSEQAQVRLAAVKCEQALTDRLGEDWLAMLPEMLPYISELQDDDDEVVDRETHRWIVKIETVLGESLDSMLQ